MQFTIPAKIFKDTLDLIVSVVDYKDTSVLSSVLIESVGKDKIQITGINATSSIQRICEASVKIEGRMCVTAEKLYNVTKNLSKDITVKLETNSWSKIESGTAKFKVAGRDATSFPKFPAVDALQIKTSSEILSDMIKSTAFSVTTEETRFTLFGVKLEIGNGVAKMIATDGARIAYVEKANSGELDTILPKNTLSYLTKLPKGDLEIGENSNHTFFKSKDLILVTRKVTGSFPDYTPFTEFPVDKKVSVDLEEFKEAVKQVIVMADDKVNALKFTLTQGKLKLSTQSHESGEGEVTIACSHKGEEVVINLNSAFLSDFVGTLKQETLFMHFKDASSPVKFNFGKNDYKYCVMPLRA